MRALLATRVREPYAYAPLSDNPLRQRRTSSIRTASHRESEMNAKWTAIVAIQCTAAVFAAGPAAAQEREDRTLLTQAQMTAIINEVSGERAIPP